MYLQKCKNGHFYDGDRFTECPHCGIYPNFEIRNDDYDSTPTLYGPPVSGSLFKQVPSDWAMPQHRPDEVTPGISSEWKGTFRKGPVVGWLVILNGTEKGQCKNLYLGRNNVGRGPEVDISLSDRSIHRGKRTIIVFEPSKRVYYAVYGDSHELFYVNGKVALKDVELVPYDRLKIGSIELLFVPLCCDRFAWKPEEYEIEENTINPDFWHVDDYEDYDPT